MFGTSSPGVLHLTGAVSAVSDDELDNVSLDEINEDGDVLSSQSPAKRNENKIAAYSRLNTGYVSVTVLD